MAHLVVKLGCGAEFGAGRVETGFPSYVFSFCIYRECVIAIYLTSSSVVMTFGCLFVCFLVLT